MTTKNPQLSSYTSNEDKISKEEQRNDFAIWDAGPSDHRTNNCSESKYTIQISLGKISTLNIGLVDNQKDTISQSHGLKDSTTKTESIMPMSKKEKDSS